MAQITLRRPKSTLRKDILRRSPVLASVFFLYIIHGWFDQTPKAVLLPDSVRPEEVLDHLDLLYPRKCRTQRPIIADIRTCYPDAPLQQPWLDKGDACASPDETTPITWAFLQQCISGRRTDSQPIGQIHVIGERNSGTKWLQRELEHCFPRATTGIRSHRDFFRSKHFFQPPSRGQLETSLVVAIVRDPHEWAAAMRERPYHMPRHMAGFDTSNPQLPAIPLEWSEFVQRPWTIAQRSPEDLQIMSRQQTDTIRCAQGFAWDEVTPCYFDNSTLPRAKWRGHVPIYELKRDHSGQPFDDMLKLRSDKALNFFLEVPLLLRLGGFLAVRYEDLVEQGTRSWMEKVAKEMLDLGELPPNCQPQAPHPERLGKRKIEQGFSNWIQDHLVPETEHMLGYH